MRPSFLRGRPRRGPERRRHVALTKGVEGVGRIGPSEARVCNRVTKIKGREVGRWKGKDTGRRDTESRVCTHVRVSTDVSTSKRGKKAKLDHGRIGPRIKSISSLSTLARSFVQILKIIIVSGAIDIFVGRMTETEKVVREG